MKSSVGPSWEKVREQLFTKEEIQESDSRVSSIGEQIQKEKEDSK